MSVATRFLVDIPDVQADVRESLSLHMAFAHLAVADASQRKGQPLLLDMTLVSLKHTSRLQDGAELCCTCAAGT